jgi:hypothetical protein
MKKQLIIPLIFLIGFISCQQNESAKSKTSEVNLQKKILRAFSSSSKQDTFSIRLTGKTPKEMLLIFTITDFSGKNIYHQILKANDIIDSYKHTVKLDRESEQIEFLKQEATLFFEDENFLEPAITKEEFPDKNTIDKAFYDELKKTGLNGFKYRLGKETKIYIGWSVTDHKVKTYYTCC